MKSFIVPKLSESEPFEVAMGGYEVTYFVLLDTYSQRNLAPNKKFKNFLELSPSKDFSILVSWNSVRDERDLTLEVLNNLTGQIDSLGPIHSIPTNIRWINDNTVEFATDVRPSISKLKITSEYDLAKPTQMLLTRTGEIFQIKYIKYC